MLRTYYLLIFICLAHVCCSQTNNSVYGVVLTKTITEGKKINTSQLLYCRTKADDRLSVYKVEEGVVSEATGYYLANKKNALYLYSNPLVVGQQTKDSLYIEFQDAKHTVLINNDSYLLFPAYYTLFKQQVKVKHSVMALLSLLADDIGDYPIQNVLPLLAYKPQFDKHIQQSKIITQRSQADIKDTWTCKYYYSKLNKLDSIRAYDAEETRFYKKVNYSSKATTVNTYLDIESRQITDAAIKYINGNNSKIKWQQHILETGKNRETDLMITLLSHDLGILEKIEPTPAEVIKLIAKK